MLTEEKVVKLEQKVEKDKEIAEMVKDIEEEFNEDIIEEYHKLASELGYSTPQIVRKKLLRFLKKNNLKVYDRLKVEAFLDGQYGARNDDTTGNDDWEVTESKPGWCWVGLTDKQNKVSELRKPNGAILARKGREEAVGHIPISLGSVSSWVNTGDFINFGTTAPSSGYSGDIESGRTYKSEIPMRVLQLISAIKTEIPELSFFVSTVAIPKPDPFLYVTCEGMEGEIISHWDEPGFVG